MLNRFLTILVLVDFALLPICSGLRDGHAQPTSDSNPLVCSTFPKQPAPLTSTSKAEIERYGAAVTNTLWDNGTVLKVHFMDGTDTLKRRVADAALEWTAHANIKFEFYYDPITPPPSADIRVTFEGHGYNSHVGTACRAVARQGTHTMRLGGLTADDAANLKRVVLHEFGHALGLQHEHQSPAAHFEWNKTAVYDYYARTQTPPWTKEMVDSNVFAKLLKTGTNYTQFDAHSIMLYGFPREFVKTGDPTPWNTELSALDKEFIARLYPKVGNRCSICGAKGIVMVEWLEPDVGGGFPPRISFKTKTKKFDCPRCNGTGTEP